MQVFTLTGVACWRCGKRGHLSKDCPQPDARPCVFCARYGHEGLDCPDSEYHRQLTGCCYSHQLAVLQPPLCYSHQPASQQLHTLKKIVTAAADTLHLYVVP